MEPVDFALAVGVVMAILKIGDKVVTGVLVPLVKTVVDRKKGVKTYRGPERRMHAQRFPSCGRDLARMQEQHETIVRQLQSIATQQVEGAKHQEIASRYQAEIAKCLDRIDDRAEKIERAVNLLNYKTDQIISLDGKKVINRHSG